MANINSSAAAKPQLPIYSFGSLVFAKMKGYPHWPARIEGVSDGTPKKIKYHIYFFGTKQVAICQEKDIVPYIDNVGTLGKPKKYKYFLEALSEIEEEYLRNSRSSQPSRDNSLSLLKIEAQLLDIEFHIRESLNLKNPKLDEALTLLDDLCKMKITPLMLKKHPEILDTLVKVRSYFGNVEIYDLTEEEKQSFFTKAEMVRKNAKKILETIKNLFTVPPGETFPHFFEQELKRFEERTKGMTRDKFVRLVTDPTI